MASDGPVIETERLVLRIPPIGDFERSAELQGPAKLPPPHAHLPVEVWGQSARHWRKHHPLRGP